MIPCWFIRSFSSSSDKRRQASFRPINRPAPCEQLLKQIGTLGGGNHFIEIKKDTETSDVWVMIHSGSRNIGLKVANHYNKIAQYWNEKWYSEMVSGLAYLPMETQMAICLNAKGSEVKSV